MGNSDAEGKKIRARGAKTRCDRDTDRKRDRRVGQLGEKFGDQSIGTGDSDRVRKIADSSRLESLGGIYSQLLEEAEEQLAELGERLEDAKTKVVKYEQRIERLQARRQQILDSLEAWRQTLQS